MQASCLHGHQSTVAIKAPFKLYTQEFGFKVKNKWHWGFAVLDAASRVVVQASCLHGQQSALAVEAEVAALIERGVQISEIQGKDNDWRWATFTDANPFFLWEGDEG